MRARHAKSITAQLDTSEGAQSTKSESVFQEDPADKSSSTQQESGQLKGSSRAEDVDLLLEENARLKELVKELSKLVLKHVVDKG